MYVVSTIASEEQAEKFLVPVIDGRQRSVFEMTEPGGAGSTRISLPPKRFSRAPTTRSTAANGRSPRPTRPGPGSSSSTAALVGQAGRNVYTQKTDVADPEQCQQLVDAAINEFGRVDVLVNNAGAGTAVPATR